MVFRRVLALAFMLLTFGAASRAQAQGMGGINFDDPDFQEMMGTMQEIGQRIQEANIDMTQMFQGIQDGSFDPEAFQQELIDKGVITNEIIGKLQTTGTRLALNTIRTQLGSTDEEWKVLLPKMQKVVTGMSSAGTGLGGAGRTMMMPGGAGTNGAVSKALAELRAVLKDPLALDDKVSTKLRAYREARKKADEELVAARKDLTSVLTLRQEVILLNFGIIE